MDLAYPARREFFFVAVERPESKFSDSVAILTPAGSGVAAFPCCSLLRSSISACSTMLEKVTFAQGVESFVSSIFFVTQSWSSTGIETFCVLIVFMKKI